MRLTGCVDSAVCRMHLLIDTALASYPVTVDPLLNTVKKLTASDADSNDHFGASMSICDDTLVIEAPNEHGAVVDRGSAHVFDRNTNDADHWDEVKNLNLLKSESSGLPNRCHDWSIWLIDKSAFDNYLEAANG